MQNQLKTNSEAGLKPALQAQALQHAEPVKDLGISADHP
jgi:hypothetical protein